MNGISQGFVGSTYVYDTSLYILIYTDMNLNHQFSFAFVSSRMYKRHMYIDVISTSFIDNVPLNHIRN